METLKTVHFQISSEWLTDHIRGLWAEGSYRLAMDTLDCLIGLEREHKEGVIRGTHKLIDRDGESMCVEDSWQPDLDYCAYGQYPDPGNMLDLAEKGARFDKEIARLEDIAIGAIRGLQRDGMARGDVIADLEFMLMQFSEEALERNKIESRRMTDYPNIPSDTLVYGSVNEGYVRNPKYDSRQDMYAEIGIPNVDAYVKRQLELDKMPLPEPDKDLISKNGYILPNGDFLPCELMEHNWLASKIKEDLGIDESLLVSAAISQITGRTEVLWLPSPPAGQEEWYEPTTEQRATGLLWATKHEVRIPDWCIEVVDE